MTDLTKAQQQAIAIANARRRAAAQPKAQPYDNMGFPVEAPGGSSTNSQAVAELGSGMDAAFQGLHNSAFLGFGDNVQGGMAALLGESPLNPSEYFGGMGDRYSAERDNYRAQLAGKEAQYPAQTMAGSIGGALIPAVASAPYATGKGLMGTIGRGMGIGAVEGGLQGAGNANGQDVLANAGIGAMIGGGLGAVIPAGVALAKSGVMDLVTGAFDAMVNRANTGKAAKAIGGMVRQSGVPQEEIVKSLARAATEGQPMYSAMDALGRSGQRQASGIARSGGDAGADIAAFLEKRQMDQADRVGGFVDDAFGTKGTTAAKTAASLTAARGDAANLAYDAARGNAAPVDVRGALGAIDARIGGMKGSDIAGDSIDGKLAKYRGQLAGSGKGLGPDITGAELSDFDRVLGVKQAVQDDIGAAVRAGRNNEARELGKLASELDGALEASSGMYLTANDQFRNASRVIGAVDEGASMATRGRAADNIPAFQSMNSDMQGAARVGYGDALLSALEKNPAITANKAKPLSQSGKASSQALAMAVDPELYARRLARENEMWGTQNRALGGSMTADNLQDIEGVGGKALGAAGSAVMGNVGEAARRIAGLLVPMAKGQNDATRQMIAKALMSNDMAVLAPLIKREAKGQGVSRVIEALLRNTGGEAGR